MDCLLVFFFGAVVGALGVFFALWFDLGMDKLASAWRWLFGGGRDD